MSFKDGRIGVGKDPIFPLDVGGSCRIDGDLILGGRFSDSQGNPITFGGGTGSSSTPDQNQDGLPSWNGGTITTQGLGVFKGRLDTAKDNILISGNNSWNANTTGTGNTTLGYGTGYSITSGTKNVLIGKDAGFQLSSSNYNTFVGYEAGMNSNHSQNTFIGYEAGKANTNGFENTFVGTFCGKNNTTAINGVFVGRCAGFSNTSGNYNTFIGMNAGRMNTTGINNCCLGFEAGRDITTGSRNIAIGSHAMHDNVGSDGYMIAIGPSAMQNYGSRVANTSTNRYCIAIGYQAMMGLNGSSGGENNVAIGSQAMRQITSGYGNVSIGRWGGYSISTGYYNTSIGHHAGYGITTGSYNVNIGGYAGYGITTGTHNSFLGPQAGYSCTTGYYNVNIGYNADYYNTGGAYNIAIGYHAGKSHTDNNNRNYYLYINSHGGRYGEDGFIYGYMYLDTPNERPFLNVNADLNAGYKNTGAHPSTITNGYNWQGSVWNDDGTITWKAGVGGTAGGMAPRGGWDANTTYVLTVTSKTTAGSYTLGGTSFNPGTSYSTQVKEFTGSLGEIRNNWGTNNEITFKRWDVSIKNKKMLNVHRLGGVGINDDRVFDDDFGHLYIDSADFPTLRRGGRDYTSRSVLTVGGSMILSTISGGSDNSSSNIYFNAPNAAFQTGLIWRRENPGAITYISGAILFDSELQDYSTNTTTGFSAGGLSFYTSNFVSTWSNSVAKRRMVIHGSGNVGIGDMTDPTHKLQIDGGILADYIAIPELNLHEARFGHVIEYRYSGLPTGAPTNVDEMDSEFGSKNPHYITTNTQMRDDTSDGGSYFGKVWIGIVRATSSGVYTFGVNSDDASDMFVGGYRVADWYSGHGYNATITLPGGNSRTIYLTPGWYKIKARFEEGGGADAFYALWKKPGDTDFSEIPASNLGYILGDYTDNLSPLSTSDDRLKVNETTITNATETIIKLKPQIYDKFQFIGDVHDTKNIPIRESGLIAQDIWYDAPELKHLVYPDKTPNETREVNEDIQQDPDYSDWGPGAAQLNYIGLIPYLVKSFQELHEKLIIENQKLSKENQNLSKENQNLSKENQEQNVKILDLYKENEKLKARLAKIESFLGI